RIKGNKSFSELLRELLRERKGNAHVLKRIFGILSEDEYLEVKRRLKELEEEFEKWEQSLTRV
ncbi:MAG: antitoxin VapB family protein, partial [Candidatus Baldrarchaeia archaeon]